MLIGGSGRELDSEPGFLLGDLFGDGNFLPSLVGIMIDHYKDYKDL